MLFEHLIYSAAIAIMAGMVHYRSVGRDYSLIIIASAYAPDIDIIVDPLLRKMGISLMLNGLPIVHGNFHNIAFMIVYSVSVAFFCTLSASDSRIRSFLQALVLRPIFSRMP